MKELEATETARRTRIIVDECGGITPYHEAFYIKSIIYSAKASHHAFERFAAAVVHEESPSVVLAAAQEALTHAAALSRFFWPVAKRDVIAVARGAKLREAFQMDVSPLKNIKPLRDALEHFDERLDKFLLRDPVGTIFPGAMVAPHDVAEKPVTQIFRLVDPWEMIFVIFGEKHEFVAICEEVHRIKLTASFFDDNGARLQKVDS